MRRIPRDDCARTLTELAIGGGQHGDDLSRERIRQIEAVAMRKLRLRVLILVLLEHGATDNEAAEAAAEFLRDGLKDASFAAAVDRWVLRELLP